MCWNLFLGKLYFSNSLSCINYLPRAALSRVFPGCAERGLGRFAGSPVTQPIPRSVCLLLNAQVGTTPPGFLGNMVLDSTTPTEALLFVDGIFHCLKIKEPLSYVWLFTTLWTIAHKSPLSMDFSGKNTGMQSVFCHSLLQGTFLTQGSNLYLPTTGSFLDIWATGEAHFIV